MSSKSKPLISVRTFIAEDEEEKREIYSRYRFLKNLSHHSSFFCPFLDILEGDRDVNYVLSMTYPKTIRDEIDYCTTKRKRISQERFFNVLLDMVLSIAQLHQKGIFVGIICPAILRMGRLGKSDLKLDFSSIALLHQKTFFLGRSPYLAPELFNIQMEFENEVKNDRRRSFSYLNFKKYIDLKNCILNESCDLWSLGVICFEYILTNKVPFSFNVSTKLFVDSNEEISEKEVEEKEEFFKNIYVDLLKFLVFYRKYVDPITSDPNREFENKLLKDKEEREKNQILIVENEEEESEEEKLSEGVKKKGKSKFSKKSMFTLTENEVLKYKSAFRRFSKIDRSLREIVLKLLIFEPSKRTSLLELTKIIIGIIDKRKIKREKGMRNKASKFDWKRLEEKKKILENLMGLTEESDEKTMKDELIDSIFSKDIGENSVVSNLGGNEKGNETDENLLQDYYLKWKMYYEKKKILKYFDTKRELYVDPSIFRLSPISGILSKRRFADNIQNVSKFVNSEISYMTVSELNEKQLKLPFTFFHNWHSKKFDEDSQMRNHPLMINEKNELVSYVPRSLKHVNGIINYSNTEAMLFNTILDDGYDNNEILQFELVKEFLVTLERIRVNRDPTELVKLLKKYRKIPPILRAQIWDVLLIGLDKSDEEIRKAFNGIRSEFKTPYDKQIKVDIVRCHQYHVFLKSPKGKSKLMKVLKSFCIDNQFCYLQGLDSVCAPILCLYPHYSAKAYFCLKAVVQRYLRGYFIKKNFSDEIERSLKVFEILLKEHEFAIFQKLRSLSLHLQSFSLPWILTIFSHTLTIENVYKLWDFILIQSLEEGIRGKKEDLIVFYVAIAFLKKMKKEIMSSSFSQIISLFKDLNSFDIKEIIELTRELMKK